MRRAEVKRGERRSPARLILIGSALVIAGIIAGAAWVLWDFRQATWNEAVKNSENISASFQHDIERNIEIFDQSLTAVVNRLQIPYVWSLEPDARDRVLFDGALRAQFIGNVEVMDADGHVLAAAPRPSVTKSSFDPAYLKLHRAKSDLGLYIGTPYKDPQTGEWCIALSRRINNANGEFAGIVVGSLRLDLFQRLFETVDLGPGSGAALVHTEKALIAHTPYKGADIGRDISDWYIFTHGAEPQSVFTALARLDGVERLYVNRQLSQYPLVLCVFRPVAGLMAPWWETVEIVAGIVAALAVIAGVHGLLFLTELRRRDAAERRMAASEYRYRLLAENSQDIISRLSLDGVRHYTSPAVGTVYGRDPDKLIGTNVLDDTHPSDRPILLAAFDALRNGQEYVVLTTRKKRADGSYAWIESAMRRTTSPDGGEPELVAVGRDATARKQNEEELIEAKRIAEAANHAKMAFLSNMSHELRTPLNAIIGFSDLIVHQMFGPVGNPLYLEYITDIRTSGEHLLQMVNDILDHAKADEGRLELHEGTIDVGQLLDFAAHVLAPRADKAKVALTTSVAPEIRVLRGDELRIKQILLNLGTNGIKFTPEHGKVEMQAFVDDGEFCLRVSDNGIGIAEDEQATVFEPFTQARKGQMHTHEGTGLGLPLTKRLVELHGGSVELHSALGQGTTITARFPASRLITKPRLVAENAASGPLVSEDKTTRAAS